MDGSLDRFFAEALLRKAGISSEPARLALERLMKSAREGHLCIQCDELERLPSSLVSLNGEPFPKQPVVCHNGLAYLQKNWVYETYILEHIRRLRGRSAPACFQRPIFEDALSSLLDAGQLLEGQASALQAVLDRQLTIISGGPGTGKTYTTSRLVELLCKCRQEKRPMRVLLAAPTGKAATHLASALSERGGLDAKLQIEASTLHRLLRLQPGVTKLFSGHELDADLVIVDEASMIDVPLLAHLLEAIGDETLLVLLGDPDQLPPVETGSLFAELSALYGRALKTCVRTDEAHLKAISEALRGEDAETFFSLLRQNDGCAEWLEWPLDATLPEKLFKKLDPCISDAELDPDECLKRYNRFRVLNAVRQGPNGADLLNRQILQLVRKSAQGKWWAAPILATVNDSFSESYNGMSGILVGGKDLTAYFPDKATGKMRQMPTLPPYELSFCLSIHKSQGSEFEKVLALFPEGSENFGKEALYTSLTRAKKRIEILGNENILRKMIGSSSRRMSGFTKRSI